MNNRISNSKDSNLIGRSQVRGQVQAMVIVVNITIIRSSSSSMVPHLIWSAKRPLAPLAFSISSWKAAHPLLRHHKQ